MRITLEKALNNAKALWAQIEGNPVHEAHWLLQHITGLSYAKIALESKKRTLSFDENQAWNLALSRRARGEPIAYIIGTAPFMGEDFLVSPDVLIPREDTEVLVNAVLAIVENSLPLDILELGVGSGAPLCMIGKKIAKSHRLFGVDISDAALRVTQKNLERHQVTASLLNSHWFSALAHLRTTHPRQYGVIYANPPYIDAHDRALRADGVCAEPRQALIAEYDHGIKGMAALALIIRQAHLWLLPQSWLILEHGYQQGAATRAWFHACGYRCVETRQDAAGHERITMGRSP